MPPQLGVEPALLDPCLSGRVDRVLRDTGRLRRHAVKPGKMGTGFVQPLGLPERALPRAPFTGTKTTTRAFHARFERELAEQLGEPVAATRRVLEHIVVTTLGGDALARLRPL